MNNNTSVDVDEKFRTHVREMEEAILKAYDQYFADCTFDSAHPDRDLKWAETNLSFRLTMRGVDGHSLKEKADQFLKEYPSVRPALVGVHPETHRAYACAVMHYRTLLSVLQEE